DSRRPRREVRDSRPVRPDQPETWGARARLTFQMIPKAIVLVWQATPRLATFNAILTVVQGILPAITIYFSKAIVDGVITAYQTQARADTLHVLTLVVLWFGVQLLSSFLQTLGQLITSMQTDLLSNSVSVTLMEKAN